MSQGYQAILPQRLFTSTGAPADGWTIKTFEAGTTTPLETFSNGALTSSQGTSFQTSADGYFTCFVAKGVDLKFEVYDDSNVLQYTLDTVEAMIDPTAAAPDVTVVPTGGILMYGAASAPTGFLLCNGALVARATYADLFAVIGTTFGAGDGSSTFALPDLRQRFPMGVAASGTGNTLGGTGGAIDHTHTGPSHTHVVSVPRAGWGDVNVNPDTAGMLLVGSGSGLNNYMPTGDQDVTSAAGGTGTTGTANGPFLAVNFIIKT